jgi:hypothetical protein
VAYPPAHFVFLGGALHCFGDPNDVSRTTRRKPIICLQGVLEGDHLRAGGVTKWPGFGAFEALLRRPGPWIAGIDFPFGQPGKLVRNMGWPCT